LGPEQASGAVFAVEEAVKVLPEAKGFDPTNRLVDSARVHLKGRDLEMGVTEEEF
jgi:hypothetical protein